MSIDTLRAFLLWCTIINYGVLLLWIFCFVFARDWIDWFANRCFRLSAGQLDVIGYSGIVLYKLGILLFNLIPYIALRIVG